MIERASEFGSSAAQPLVPGDTSLMSAGEMLRQARESLGLHLEMVAAALKVTPQKLQALEDDRLDALPDAVFARALAASTARILRIDPGPVLAKLPGAARDGLAQADRSMSGNIRADAQRTSARVGGGLSRPLMVLVALLLAAAALLYWVPQSAVEWVGQTLSRWTSRESATEAPSAAPTAAPAAAPGTVVESVTPTLPVAPTPPVPALATPVPVPAAAPASVDLVTFSARDEAWIKVTEGGRVLLERTLKAGESASVNGTPPLSVVVGRAAGVDVQVRGQPFALAPLTRGGGVARFEIKPEARP